MKITGVIPARLGSTRLAEKVLKTIQGRPMIQHVWESVRRARLLDDLIIATDHERVRECAQAFGAKVMMTSTDHPNGTSRVAEVAEREDADVFINIQGDEPMMHPEAVDKLAEVLRADKNLQVATVAVRRSDAESFDNPNVVKVVCDEKGNGLYFSRAPIPFWRDGRDSSFTFLKHLGIYGYRRQFLLDFVLWPAGKLEQLEKLEQLRILERGFSIRVVETKYDSLSVDTAEDLAAVEMRMGN